MFLFHLADQGCWKRENKINVSCRKGETCDVHVYCNVLCVLLARWSVDLKKKNKSYGGHCLMRAFAKIKWNWMVEMEDEEKWFSDIYVTFSLF